MSWMTLFSTRLPVPPRVTPWDELKAIVLSRRTEFVPSSRMPVASGRSQPVAAREWCETYSTLRPWRRIESDDPVGAVGHRNRPFRVLSERQARNAEHGGFFLDAAAIGQNHAGVRHQTNKG